jgi:glycosyltransferase involved in cell wall biosynthesis
MPLPSDPAGFQCQGVRLPSVIDKSSLVKRYIQENHYGALAADAVRQFAPHVVISGNTPLDSQAIIQKHCKLMGVPFIYWVQDLVGIGTHKVMSRRLPVAGPLIGKHYVNLERRLLAESSHVVLIAEDFRPFLPDKNAPNISVIENWAPLEEMPLRPRVNAWAKRNGLDKSLNLIYSGTLGMKHNPDLLLQLALHFRNSTPRVNVVVITGGAGGGWLKEKKQELGVDNLILMPFQPYEEVPDVLASADVLLSILDESAGVFSVPSKVLSYACAGRPMLLAVPPENLAAKIVTRNGMGVVVSPSDLQGFITAGKQLLNNPARREQFGCNARAYAERNFDIQAITDRFEMLALPATKCIVTEHAVESGYSETINR